MVGAGGRGGTDFRKGFLALQRRFIQGKIVIGCSVKVSWVCVLGNGMAIKQPQRVLVSETSLSNESIIER